MTRDTKTFFESHASIRRRAVQSRKTRSLRVYMLALTLGIGISGCGGSNSTQKQNTASTQVLEKADPFVVLDEQSKAGTIDPRLIDERLDAARQQWLRALAAQQQNDKTAVVRHFESAIDILNHLISYPSVDENKDFQELTKSVIEDYEKFVAKIDSLPSNASVFALKQKFDEEMAKMDIRNVPMPRADLSKTTIPLPMNTAVEQTIAYFTQGNGRPYMSKWLARTGKYFPMMRPIMKEQGVPEEMVHLAMIESGLNPNAVSWAKAVGMWQFIDATGSRYGLNNNWWLDKRRDPVAATRAAAHHLKDLYNALGDWHLALAAYNSGINRVRSAMAQAGSNDFWTIRPFLPKETQNYVPLFIAATLIEMDPAHYGFTGITPERPLSYDTVYVKEAIDLSAVAKAAGVSSLEIKELNPDLLQPSTPPLEICGANGYCLRLPVGTSTTFNDRLALIPPQERRPWLTHIVQRGETMNSLARTYGLSSTQLAEYNDMSSGDKLRRGMRVRIPMSVMAPQTGTGSNTATAPADQSEPATAKIGSTRLISHKVKKGETLYSIADRYGVSVTEIKSANGLRKTKALKKGQVLKIPKTVMAAKKSNVTKSSVALNASSPSSTSSQSLSQTSSSDKSVTPVTAPSSKKTLAAKSTKPSKHWVTYKVQRGDTYGKIADNFDVSVTDLKSWNKHILKHGVKAGQALKVYASNDVELANSGEDADASATGKAKIHTVRSGETMTRIAKMYSVSVNQVAQWNNMEPSDLQAGQQLKIYGNNKTTSLGDRAADHPAKKGRHRVVAYRTKRGDTLAEIADKYGVTVHDLKVANRLHTSNIPVGKKLVIPNE